MVNDESPKAEEKKQELNLFLFIVVVLFPLLSIALMGSYGFVVWMAQLIMGPPAY